MKLKRLLDEHHFLLSLLGSFCAEVDKEILPAVVPEAEALKIPCKNNEQGLFLYFQVIQRETISRICAVETVLFEQNPISITVDSGLLPNFPSEYNPVSYINCFTLHSITLGLFPVT